MVDVSIFFFLGVCVPGKAATRHPTPIPIPYTSPSGVKSGLCGVDIAETTRRSAAWQPPKRMILEPG